MAVKPLKREIEERYREERQWQDRVMFDSRTTMAMNYYFPTAQMLSASRSPVLPSAFVPASPWRSGRERPA